MIPLATPLQRFFETELPLGDGSKAPLFPSANDVVFLRHEDRVGTLSGRFYALMAEAGLVEPAEARPHWMPTQLPGTGLRWSPAISRN